MLHDEDKGIGFSRGLSPDGCQTFEMFLPPDTAVQLANGDIDAQKPDNIVSDDCSSSMNMLFGKTQA